jgi:multiple sugar transport system substrate-binding protein
MKLPSLEVLIGATAILFILASACSKEAATPINTEIPVLIFSIEPTIVMTEVPVVVEPTTVPTEGPTLEPCAPATDGPLAGVDPRGQNVIWWHNRKDEEVNPFVDEFNFINFCGITVQAQNQGSYNDIRVKMNTSIATGELPGIVVGYQNDEAFYALAGGLVDINPYLTDPYWGLTATEQSDFNPVFLQQSVHPAFDNMRLGFPPHRSAEVIFYNQTWLEELGFSGPPTTPNEFKEMACAAAKSNSDGTGGYILRSDASGIASWTYAFGGDILSNDGLGYVFNSPATADSVAFLKSMLDGGCAYLLTEGYPDTAFAARQAIFTEGSTSGLPYYIEGIAKVAKENNRDPDEWGVIAIPHTTSEPLTNIYGGDLIIPSSSSENQLAS